MENKKVFVRVSVPKKTLPAGRTARGRFAKENKHGEGRQKGVRNKFTNLKKAYLAVFEKIESESKTKKKIDSFYDWATKNEKNQGEFYKMLSKMLPTNVTVDGEIPLMFEISEKYMPKKRGKKCR